MRLPIYGTIAGVLLLLAVPAQGASQKDYEDCSKGTGDTRIVGCSSVIDDFDESPRNRAMAYYYRGDAWRAKDQPDRAIADYGEAIRLDLKLAEVYVNRGIAWSKKKDYDRAIADYSEAIRFDPSHILAHYTRGLAWHEKKDYDRAIADYSEAIRLNTANATGMPKQPAFSWVHLHRALSYEKIGKRDKVIEDLKFAAAYIEQKWWNDELIAKLAEYKLTP